MKEMLRILSHNKDIRDIDLKYWTSFQSGIKRWDDKDIFITLKEAISLEDTRKKISKITSLLSELGVKHLEKSFDLDGEIKLSGTLKGHAIKVWIPIKEDVRVQVLESIFNCEIVVETTVSKCKEIKRTSYACKKK